MLRNEGFTRWGKIELDDEDIWEVDNAHAFDGHRYDLPERIEVLGDHHEGPRVANHIVSVVIFETARDVTPRHSRPRG
jgi:hypothetical protein